jgi:DNA-binding CsgD family transcriptional regulator
MMRRAVGLRRRFDFIDEHAVMTPAEIARDPYFQEFRRPVGFGGIIARSDTSGAPADWSIISIQRAPDQPFPDGDAAVIARRLLGHVARARSVAALTLPAADWSHPLADAVDACPLALAVTTPAARVLHANPAFRRIAALRLEKGQLQAATATGTASLLALIAAAARPNLDRDGDDCAVIRRAAAEAPVVVRAVGLTPERNAGRDGLPAERGVLLVAVDTGAAPPADVAGQLRRLGLTRAETRLAVQIGRGLGLSDIAEAGGVSEHTLRSHMRAIFAKLDLSRQAELVRLTTRLETISRPDDAG